MKIASSNSLAVLQTSLTQPSPPQVQSVTNDSFHRIPLSNPSSALNPFIPPPKKPSSPLEKSFAKRVVLYDSPIKSNKTRWVYCGNGGGGLAGLMKHLANDFHQTKSGKDIPIAWVKAHTDENFEYLKNPKNPMQLALTYLPQEEQELYEKGILHQEPKIAFLDSFRLVGPKKTNIPKELGLEKEDSILEFLTKIATFGRKTRQPILLYRVGNSATTVRLNQLFEMAGLKLTPQDKRTWIRLIDAYPPRTLMVAQKDALFTLTDKGTCLAAGWKQHKIRHQQQCYYEGSNKLSDPLLNSCQLIVKAGIEPNNPAHIFANWLLSEKGQNSIRTFVDTDSGLPFFSPANSIESA